MSWIDDHDEPGGNTIMARGSVRRVFGQMAPYFRAEAGTFVKAGLLVIVVTAATLAGPQILRMVINLAVDGGSGGQVLALALAFIGITVTGMVLNYAMTMIVTRGGLRIVMGLKERLFRHVASLGMRFHHENPPGRLLARIESDTERLKQLFSHAAIQLFSTVLLLVGVIAVMLLEDWRTTASVLIFVPVAAMAVIFMMRVIRKLYRICRRRYADMVTFVTEYAQGVDVIQHHGDQQRTMHKLEAVNDARVSAETRASYVSYGFWAGFVLIEVGAAVAVVAIGSQRVASGAMDVGTLVMFLEYLRQLFLPFLMLTEFLAMLQQGVVAGERVFGILALESGETASTPAADGEAPALPDRLREGIRFDGVSFAYIEGRDVLHDVSFDVRAGQTVALVGPSGGGKSTLANMLLGFYAPRAGRITIDGTDLRDIPTDEWRRHVGLVLQGVHLFPGTLRENLTVFDPTVSDEAIDRALGIVQARGVVDRQPHGLDTPLAERGANLSLGERQLVSFARALIHDPPLLLLDEATASVDPVTERRIQHSLERMLDGRTAFVIAHRLATITGADSILVIEDGRLLEQGTHSALVARNGRYRELVDLQFAADERSAS